MTTNSTLQDISSILKGIEDGESFVPPPEGGSFYSRGCTCCADAYAPTSDLLTREQRQEIAKAVINKTVITWNEWTNAGK
jgi:hypothetical protein